MKFNISLIHGLTILALGFSSAAHAQNLPVVHWVNEAGANAVTVLNSNLNGTGVFITDFKGRNDLTVTRLTADSISFYTDSFGGGSPGNNPAYLTNFVGTANNGTGDGTAGDLENLDMSSDSTGTLQFDFLYPLTPQDRILLIDVDGPEAYLLQAYVITGSATNPVSLATWTASDFSGTTGTIPDSSWPVWNPTTGTLVSGTSGNLNEELFVLAPAQNINRLVITKQGGSGWSTDINLVSLQTPLTIREAGTNVVLTWTNSAFGLQAAPAVTGNYTNVPGATSPYTNAITDSQKFFRPNTN